MTERISDLAEIALPYRRRMTLRRVEFESGMIMVRMVIREGTRITQVDLDGDTAQRLARELTRAAEAL